MRIKKFKTGLMAVVLCFGLCFGLTGCGENAIPEMTESEMQAIGEYAAFIVMKYDASNRSRLVTLPPEPTPAPAEQTEPETPKETEEPSGMGEVDNTPITDLSQEEKTDSMEEVLGLAEGLSVSYVDAELCDNYPHEEELDFFVPASEGNKLLVLHFRFSNGTGQDQTIDILGQKEMSFRITVNEDYKRNAMRCLLSDDMTMFKQTISAGESTEAVLIIEVTQNSMEEINSISLNLKNDSNACTIRLK